MQYYGLIILLFFEQVLINAYCKTKYQENNNYGKLC